MTVVSTDYLKSHPVMKQEALLSSPRDEALRALVCAYGTASVSCFYDELEAWDSASPNPKSGSVIARLYALIAQMGFHIG